MYVNKLSIRSCTDLAAIFVTNWSRAWKRRATGDESSFKTSVVASSTKSFQSFPGTPTLEVRSHMVQRKLGKRNLHKINTSSKGVIRQTTCVTHALTLDTSKKLYLAIASCQPLSLGCSSYDSSIFYLLYFESVLTWQGCKKKSRLWLFVCIHWIL